MKKTIIKAAIFSGIAFASLTACTDGYLDFNTNPYEVTGEEMKRDGYLVRAALTGMQGWVIPTDVNCNQFTETLVGGPFSGYIAESNQGFGYRFSNFNQSNNWNRVFYTDTGVALATSLALTIGAIAMTIQLFHGTKIVRLVPLLKGLAATAAMAVVLYGGRLLLVTADDSKLMLVVKCGLTGVVGCVIYVLVSMILKQNIIADTIKKFKK